MYGSSTDQLLASLDLPDERFLVWVGKSSRIFRDAMGSSNNMRLFIILE